MTKRSSMHFFSGFRQMLPLLCFLAAATLPGTAQVVWTDPVFPSQTDDVVVYYDATKGNGALAGYTGTIYAHTGVITNYSSSPNDWRHVQGNWGVPDPERAMTPLGNDIYKIEFNINEFYGITDPNEVVQAMAFVFRNADGSIVGREADGSDIFTPVYSATSELLVAIVSPGSDNLILAQGETINFRGAASKDATLTLTDNGAVIAQGSGKELLTTLSFDQGGNHELVFTAATDTETASDTLRLVVAAALAPMDPPAGTEDGINVLSPTSILLRLYAPGKQHVFAIGSFSNWQVDAAYQLRQATDGATWWIQIDDLPQGEPVTFQYLVDGQIRIADPYSTLVLDPWNDSWVPSVTWPGLPPYPDGASGIVSLVYTEPPAYDWQHDDYARPSKSDLVVYELLLRDFLSRHDFQTLRDTLDYLQRLGVNAIELMPVSEFEGNISWGYNPSFHMALDKYYGTPQAFKMLVDECHARGMAVILDVVYNHAFGQSPLVQLYWDAAQNRPADDNPWFNPVPRHPFNVGYDFNHESAATKRYVGRTLRYWLEEYHVDGFRFDLSKGFTQKFNTDVGAWSAYDASRIAILEAYADTIWQTNPEAYVILEHFADWNEEKVLSDYGMMVWGNMNHQYLEASMGYASDLRATSYQFHGMDQPHVVAYMESHDEERMMYKNLNWGNGSGSYQVKQLPTALQRVELAATFFYTVPGPKMLWQFGELGYDYSINHCPNGTVSDDCRLAPKPIRWDYRNHPLRWRLYQVTRALIELKKAQPALETADFDMDVTGYQKRIWLHHPDMEVVVLGNFAVTGANINPAFPHAGTWYEYFSGTTLEVDDPNAPLGFQPGEYRLYTDQPVATPDGFTAVREVFRDPYRTVVLPNPTDGPFRIGFDLPKGGQTAITLTDLTGKVVAHPFEGFLPQGSHELEVTVDLPAGIYLVQLRGPEGPARARKLIVTE